MADRHPEQVAWEEARAHGLTFLRFVVDHARRYVTATLVKSIIAGGVGVGIAFYSLPTIAAIACSVAVAGGVVYGVYGRRLYHDERGSRRWTWIAAKRLQQDKLRLEQQIDAAVFDVVGKVPPLGTHSSPELRQAI